MLTSIQKIVKISIEFPLMVAYGSLQATVKMEFSNGIIKSVEQRYFPLPLNVCNCLR